MKSALALMFFASIAFAQNVPAMPSSEACGSMDVEFKVKLNEKAGGAALTDPQPDSGKAIIYVVEDQKFRAVKDATIRIGIDGSWVGAAKGNSYVAFPVAAGDHHLCVDWLSDFVPSGRLISLYGFTAEAGKAYYFRARTAGGPDSMLARNDSYSATLDLDLVNMDEGKMLVASSPLAVSHAKK